MAHFPEQPLARRDVFGILGACIAASLIPVAWGQGKGKAKGSDNAKGSDKAAGKSAKRGAGPVFSDQDRLFIHAYVRNTPGFLPSEVRGLPPGLARNLQRGKPLPPGWQKKMIGFPPVLEHRLPPLPRGYRRVVVDRWAFVVAESTNTVLDIFDLVQDR
jgi:hypothetical protein